MTSPKSLILKSIPRSIADPFIKEHHYSKSVVKNSQLSFGVFMDDYLHGVIQYGPSMDKSKVIGLVKDTKPHEFIEINRLAFDDYLPKNSESRAIAISIRLIRRNAPHIKWIITYADATRCGDGCIYRACGFLLTDIKKNKSIREGKNGIAHDLSNRTKTGTKLVEETSAIDGYMLRYIKLLDDSCQLTVPVIGYAQIDALGVGMYLCRKK